MSGTAQAKPYRPGVGIMLIGDAGRVFAGRRLDSPDAWQMPQGGIDPGESPRAAALRELVEEIGTDRAEILAESRDWLTYDLPPEIAAKVWGGRFRGQRQKWFAMRFTGADADIAIDSSAQPEFDAWRWMSAAELLAAIVPFKRALYAAVIDEFRRFLK